MNDNIISLSAFRRRQANTCVFSIPSRDLSNEHGTESSAHWGDDLPDDGPVSASGGLSTRWSRTVAIDAGSRTGSNSRSSAQRNHLKVLPGSLQGDAMTHRAGRTSPAGITLRVFSSDGTSHRPAD